MAFRKYETSDDVPLSTMPLKFSSKVHEKAQLAELESAAAPPTEPHVDIDLREVYFLIMHFLSAGPCRTTSRHFWSELLEHQLLPRRYHAWYSRSGAPSGDDNDNGLSFPLRYNELVDRYPHIGKDHLVKLMKQLILSRASPLQGMVGGNTPNAADVPTLLGSGSFSLLESDRNEVDLPAKRLPGYLRWPHMQADQVHGLSLREIGGGFTKHHRAPSIRAACYAVAKPSTMVQKMQNVKKLRGHRNAVYCAIFDRSGRYVITGSDDRLVKIWSMDTAFCLASCRGHEGDITDLAVSSNNFMVASASNDFSIRVWRLPDGAPVSVLRGHTGAVTAIAFSPRPSYVHHLLSSSDDGTCRIWDARHSQSSLRVYIPKPSDPVVGKSIGPSSNTGLASNQILCCAYNANGTVFVTGSSDTYARVWNACKSSTDDPEQPNHEMDLLSGHENDVNYVQFSGCAVASRSSFVDTSKEENIPKFKNSWFTHDNIVTCSRDGSAIIWIPRSRRSHGKIGRWTRAYHLKVPPPPMPPQTSRGGPRQRLLPTPRGVNMIVWSLDNRFVLAAIMDCRICVWNAVDGSLVHSLTGHTESTYVLDVHPFNPRIAMSAGYDGRTIVWDIWEGTPIHIYETGRFKLVDGKFSLDGTSIVLSDDVGQIYILSTGQGESQKDAKYDQFFLGDYRPLIRDVHGNVLDQETQLVPYRRNMQDLLCDSSMIPYPEPYQSMYQQRRLGALGIEWRPPSVNLAVGPVYDMQDYQILPLPDLDIMVEPMPEFLDAMDWEPENEIQSDDNDSEYNVTEEYCSEGDQGSQSNDFPGDPECSAEDSDMGESSRDGFHRSKRRKRKAVVEFMTSSGRRVKRRNLDERDSNLSQSNKTRKSKNKQKATRKKSSLSKLFRPQRVAARNALKTFSQISSDEDDDEDEDEDDSETDTSESESILLESKSYRSAQNVQEKTLKEKEAFVGDATRPPENPKSQPDAGRRKLILKFPARYPKKSEAPDDIPSGSNKQINVDCSFKAHQETIETNTSGSQDLVSSSGDGRIKITGRMQSEKLENHLDLSAGFADDKIKWGDVKARTSKRVRSGDSGAMDTWPGSAPSLDEHNNFGNLQLENNNGMPSSLSEREKPGDKIDSKVYRIEEQLRAGSSDGLDGDEELAPLKCADKSLLLGGLPQDDHEQRKGESPVTCDGSLKYSHKDEPGPSYSMENEDSLASVDGNGDDKMAPVLIHKDGTDHTQKFKENPPPIRKIRFKTRMAAGDLSDTSKLNRGTTIKDENGAQCYLKSHDPFGSPKLKYEMPEEADGPSRPSSYHGLETSEIQAGHSSRLSGLRDSKSHSDSKDKMYKVVYTRSKSGRTRTDSEGDGGVMEERTSNPSNDNLDSRVDFSEPATVGIRRTRSRGMNETTWEPYMGSNNVKVKGGHGSVETSRNAEMFSKNAREQLINEEWRSNEGLTVGLRSARNKRVNYDSDIKSLGKRRSFQPMEKLSWLTLSHQDESRRYIPQLGDSVVYIRQGHQEYGKCLGSDVPNIWRKLKGSVRSVELCKVKDLAYAFSPGGDSCCKIKLEFVDHCSSLCGQVVEVNLPELVDYADFIVEKTLYDASIQRNWTTRDKCAIWWRNGEDEGGSWWDGQIVAVKPRSPEFPDSPWETLTIEYPDDAAEYVHSPWELYDPKMPLEPPCIDEHSRDKLLSFFAELEQSANMIQDRYGIHKLNQVNWNTNRFPVPISLELIWSRLENNYYRNLEAVEHDVQVMVANVRSYFRNRAEIEKNMKRLLRSFEEVMSSL